ncbi:hypothetical protein BDF19DRAFT_302953 [Syncephalis fuscata]|nr:hypothetical protein BDF19DRAFT_302953 [Syncephalis fuscata]
MTIIAINTTRSTALFPMGQASPMPAAHTCQAWTAVAIALLDKAFEAFQSMHILLDYCVHEWPADVYSCILNYYHRYHVSLIITLLLPFLLLPYLFSISLLVRSNTLPDDQIYVALQQAVVACEQAHRLDPADVDCLYRWGRANLLALERAGQQAQLGWRLAQLGNAIRVFELASIRDPQHVGALLGLGRALSDQANLLLQQADDPENAASDVATNNAYASLQHSIVAYRRAYMAQMSFRAICGRSPPGTPTPGPAIASEEEEDVTSADALVNTIVSLIGVLAQLANLYAEQWEDDEEDDEDDQANACRAVVMAEGLYADAIHILAQAIVDVPSHRVELLAEWAELLETMAKTRADRAGSANPLLFDEALAKYEEAIDEAIAVNSELLADLHFDYGQLCHTIADTRLTELNTLHGQQYTNVEIATSLHTVVRPYFDRACAAFRCAVQANKENAVMQERLGDACFISACIAADPAAEARLLAEAERWYRNAMTVDAEDDEVVARLAQVCHRQRRIGECAALLAHWHALGGGIQDLKHEDRVFLPEFVAQVPLLVNMYD